MKAYDAHEMAEGLTEDSVEIPSGTVDVANDEGDTVLSVTAMDDGGFHISFHEWRLVGVEFSGPNTLTCRKAD